MTVHRHRSMEVTVMAAIVEVQQMYVHKNCFFLFFQFFLMVYSLVSVGFECANSIKKGENGYTVCDLSRFTRMS